MPWNEDDDDEMNDRERAMSIAVAKGSANTERRFTPLPPIMGAVGSKNTKNTEQ